MSSFYRDGRTTGNLRSKLFRSILFLVALLAVSSIAPSVRGINASPMSLTETVSIDEFSFTPDPVTINVGDTVQWDNDGAISHTTTANGGAWDSGLLAPGGSFSHIFGSPGMFPYICSIPGHESLGMVGTIIVQATVPDVEGLSQADAEAAIDAAGLTVGDVSQEFHNTVPAGNVISQDPAAGSSVAPGSAVDLVVSLGLPPVLCHGVPATIVGTVGDDVLLGTPGPDVIAGLGGDDVILGFAGGDRICGGPGNDFLLGGPGIDRVYGDAGDDMIAGGSAKDNLRGGGGNDKLQGDGGNDKMNCGSGLDFADGGAGAADTASANCEFTIGVP